MSIYDYERKSTFDELSIAMNSTNLQELKTLIHSRDLNVRRSLAKNSCIDSYIANSLANDPVLNVSYIASQHKNCTIKREFKEENISHRCVQCEKPENTINCMECEEFKH